MFDCALHFRFLQKATESMFEMGQASVAAALACQKRFCDDLAPQDVRPEPANPWPSWYREPGAARPAPVAADAMQSWFEMASTCSLAYWSLPSATPVAQTWATGTLPNAIQTFWGISPWTFYQGPMVAMMLSYGVPYAVAAPTARASTSAMDAAEAACAQWRLIFGSAEGRRSLDRNVNVAATVPGSGYLH